MEVNVGFRVMTWPRLHLTGGTIRHGRHGGQGLRLITKNDKSKFGKSNGGKITGLMIKYPHIKKNAQRCKRSAYPVQ